MPANDTQRFEALSNAFNHLLRNQDLLEKRLAHLETLLQVRDTEAAVAETHRESEAPLSTPPSAVPPIQFQPEPEQAATETVLAETGTPLPAMSEDARPGTSQIPPKAERQPGLESKVGLTVVNRIGAVTLVLGVAFFFKWAVDNNWIGPAGRVILGLLAGFATLAAGDFLWRKRQQVFAQGITATGIAIIYLSLYAAFNFYSLIPQSAAFLTMVATTAMAAVLALRYNSVAIATLGLAGAYITPLLLSTGEDHPWFLAGYLLVLNFATTELAKRGGWPRLEILSFSATVLIWGGWMADRGTAPEKRMVATLAPLAFSAQRWRTQMPLLFVLAQLLTACAMPFIWKPEDTALLLIALLIAVAGLAFAQLRRYPFAVLTAFAGFWISYAAHGMTGLHEPMSQFFFISCGFLLFLGWSYWHLVVRRATPTTLALGVFALNGVLFYAFSYYVLRAPFYALDRFGMPSTVITPGHRLWLGPLAALVAGVYLAFGTFLHRQSEKTGGDNRPVLLALGIALAFLTLAIPIQFTGFTITIAWAIQGAALAWIASRLNSQNALLGAAVVLVLVALRLVGFEAQTFWDASTYSLLWNSRFFTFTVSAVAMLLASYWASKILPPLALGSYFAGHFFMLWGLCLEILGWSARSVAQENQLSAETIAISVLFGVYAVILVSAGVATRTAINRLTGLGLFGIVVLKLYFFDVWQLGRPYQIAAFVILGILLLSTSFLYSHFRRLIETWWKDDKTTS